MPNQQISEAQIPKMDIHQCQWHKDPIRSHPDNQEMENSAINGQAFNTFEGVSSDHRMVFFTIRFNLRTNKKRQTAFLSLRTKNKTSHLKDKYTIVLKNKFLNPTSRYRGTILLIQPTIMLILLLRITLETLKDAEFETALKKIRKHQNLI